MKENNKKAFTLVELLAVIVILAVILVMAIPKVMNVIDESKKATLESAVKMISLSAEKRYAENKVLGKVEDITCESITKINPGDYASCNIQFEENIAKVTIKGAGKFDGLWICNGTKRNAVVQVERCPIQYGDGDTYIMDLLEQEEKLNNGLVQTYAIINGEQEDAGIRYAGATADVKNKVYFNCTETDGINEYGSKNYNYASSCEIWRIIGVFDTKKDESDAQSEKRIKIVRNEGLEKSMSWDTTADGVDYINQWGETTLASDDTTVYPGASLKQYLNEGEDSYYNGLSSVAKQQIEDALWYTGVVRDGTASEVYKDERGNSTGTGAIVNYTTKWVGKIGLIYMSDFGYAGTNCGSSTINHYNNENSCGKTRNWLTPDSGYYWTISSISSYSNRAWYIHSDGNALHRFVIHNVVVRPSLYLSSKVKIIGGNGGSEPYRLAI